jgi:hypothetical protein
MGRGRAKAKQTKVARQLKYNSGGTDLEALRRELVGDDRNGNGESDAADGDREPQDDDPYAAYVDDADADDADDDPDWDDDRSRR